MTDEATGKAKGGIARRNALTPEQRQQIAKNAADARWSVGVPQASYEGVVGIGEKHIYAAVLPEGKRLLSQGQFLQAIGRSRTPKGGTGALTVDGLPFFLQAEQLSPFISEELRLSTAPVFFKGKDGRKQVGYDAEILPQVCEVYLKYRDALYADGNKVPSQFDHIVKACDVLMRGLARLGIVALIDEATGYQQVRARDALQAYLDRFLRKELAAWVKTFPDEFFVQLFRLKKWQWKGTSRRPGVVGIYINDLIYDRLGPGVLQELQRRNPSENGRRKAKHFQWLTENIGNPALAQHMYATIGFMRSFDHWDDFKRAFYRAYPKKGENLALALNDPNV